MQARAHVFAVNITQQHHSHIETAWNCNYGRNTNCNDKITYYHLMSCFDHNLSNNFNEPHSLSCKCHANRRYEGIIKPNYACNEISPLLWHTSQPMPHNMLCNAWPTPINCSAAATAVPTMSPFRW